MSRRSALRPLLLAFSAAHVACSPAPRWIAVASGDRSVLLLDAALRTALHAQVPGPALALESPGDGASILVAGAGASGGGYLAWVRRSDGATLVSQPAAGPVKAIALEREGRRVFALVHGPLGGLSIRRADDLTELRALPVCADPVAVSFTQEWDRAYVTCRPGLVAEVDPKLQIVVQRAFVAADSGRACEVGPGALSGNGTLLFIPCAAAGQVLYLDRVTLKPWDSTSVPPGVTGLAVTPGAVAVALLPDSASLVLVDLRSKRRIATVTVPGRPAGVALSADGHLAFVLTSGRGPEGTLLVVDTRTGLVTTRTELPGGGQAVYVWPAPRESRMHWLAADRSGPPLQPAHP